ncbi:MAG: hypothetical protein OXU83_06605 [Gammaproteobacteria bacterium]|nr:hypothetical protein [Gammaproteobacteria bacterium]MDD9886811.1 hypothetical protein [Gammaproteobacteria bacterium]
MKQFYRDAVVRMEEAGVDPDYVLGWQSGYLGHPPREEQRVSDAYSAGRKDGEEKNADNFSAWAGKAG